VQPDTSQACRSHRTRERIGLTPSNRRRQSVALLCWLVFAAGILVQLLSPHLKISNGAFVISPEMSAGRNAIRLDEIVGGQRRMQLLSLFLTVGGAFGLAFVYREILIGQLRDEVANQARDEKP
jgi:hypothetical protein